MKAQWSIATTVLVLLATACGDDRTLSSTEPTSAIRRTDPADTTFQPAFEVAWRGGYEEWELTNAHSTLVARCMQARGWQFEPYLVDATGSPLANEHPLISLERTLQPDEYAQAYRDHEGSSTSEGTIASDGCVATASKALDLSVPAFGSATPEQAAIAQAWEQALSTATDELSRCMEQSGFRGFVAPETFDTASESFIAAMDDAGFDPAAVALAFAPCVDATVRPVSDELDDQFVEQLIATLPAADQAPTAARLAGRGE